jgi:hypothetical protein
MQNMAMIGGLLRLVTGGLIRFVRVHFKHACNYVGRDGVQRAAATAELRVRRQETKGGGPLNDWLRLRPTPGQYREFGDYLCEAHSWYKHLDLMEGRRFVVFVAADAGLGRLVAVDYRDHPGPEAEHAVTLVTPPEGPDSPGDATRPLKCSCVQGGIDDDPSSMPSLPTRDSRP